MNRTSQDILLGLGLAAFFSVVLFVVIPQAVVVPTNINVASLSPSFWPKVLCGMLICLGLGMSVSAWLSRRKSADCSDSLSAKEESLSARVLRPLTVMGVLLAYYASVEALGIIFSSILALFGLSWFYGERRLVILAPLAVLLPVLLYFFFTKVANVPLPLGTLFM